MRSLIRESIGSRTSLLVVSFLGAGNPLGGSEEGVHRPHKLHIGVLSQGLLNKRLHIKSNQMFDPVVIVQPPGLAASVLDKLEIGDRGIVIPDFTATPRANVKYMIKDSFHNAAVGHH